MQNKTSNIDRAFFVLIVLILLTGFLTTVFIPSEINSYENRYANRLSQFTAASYADSSFQKAMESALSDQVQFAQLELKLQPVYIFQILSLLLSALSETVRISFCSR